MQCSTHTLADLQNTFLSLAESCHVLPLHAIQVLCAVVVAVNVAAALLASHILGLEDNLIIVNMTIFMALGTLFFAAQVGTGHCADVKAACSTACCKAACGQQLTEVPR